MILYLCRDDNTPSGGRKVIYDQVDILNAAGIDAAVMHGQPGFRLTWFENDTRVIHMTDGLDFSDCIIAVPETLAEPAMRIFPADVRKVIVCQNAYYSHANVSLRAASHPFRHPSVLGVMCVSEDNRAVLEWEFPGLRVKRALVGVDGRRFNYQHDKGKVIACMSRKHSEEAATALHMLKWTGSLDGWTVLNIDGMKHSLVAEVMKRARIFLATGYPEGQPLPPLEALACGCVVVGYDGFGGREYWDIPAFVRVPEADTVNMARGVKEVMDAYEEYDRALSSHMVLERYSLDRQRQSVLDFWGWVC